MNKLAKGKVFAVGKRLGLALVLVIVIFAIIDFQYLLKQARYHLGSKPAPIAQNTNTAPHGEPNLLQIPSLGITAPVKYVTEANEDAYQKALEEGVVLYPGTALPGEFGNTYIFGHSSDFAFSKGKYKTVFALLPQIKNGAEIQVSNADGEIFTYIVTNQFVAAKDDLHLLEQGDRTQKQLTLQTSYPLGTALKRYIVIAQLKQ